VTIAAHIYVIFTCDLHMYTYHYYTVEYKPCLCT